MRKEKRKVKEFEEQKQERKGGKKKEIGKCFKYKIQAFTIYETWKNIFEIDKKKESSI